VTWSERPALPEEFAGKLNELVSAYLDGRETLEASGKKLANLLRAMDPAIYRPPRKRGSPIKLKTIKLGASSPRRAFVEMYSHAVHTLFAAPASDPAEMDRINMLFNEAGRLLRPGLEG